MATNQPKRTMTIKQETFDLLQMVKSCFQLGRKQNISYDDLISKIIKEGLATIDPKVDALFKMATESQNETETMSETEKDEQ